MDTIQYNTTLLQQIGIFGFLQWSSVVSCILSDYIDNREAGHINVQEWMLCRLHPSGRVLMVYSLKCHSPFGQQIHSQLPIMTLSILPDSEYFSELFNQNKVRIFFGLTSIFLNFPEYFSQVWVFFRSFLGYFSLFQVFSKFCWGEGWGGVGGLT